MCGDFRLQLLILLCYQVIDQFYEVEVPISFGLVVLRYFMHEIHSRIIVSYEKSDVRSSRNTGKPNLWRRLVLPKGIETWSLTSLQQRLVKTGGRLVKHARYYWLMLAGEALPST